MSGGEIPDFNAEEAEAGIRKMGEYLVIYSLQEDLAAHFRTNMDSNAADLAKSATSYLATEYGMDVKGEDKDEFKSLSKLVAQDRKNRWEPK